MPGKYEPLASHLSALPSDQTVIELTFAEVDRIVGGLPASARTLRPWWANSSHGQALAWRSAGWHVDKVDFANRRVRFARGRVGGTRADRLNASRSPAPAPWRLDPPSVSAPPAVSLPEAVDQVTIAASTAAPGAVDVSVRFSWRQLGRVTLDAAGKVAFPRPLPSTPGLYRMHFVAVDGDHADRFYIGETDNLRRRLGSNYRNPGPRQQTSLRINAALLEHLAADGQVEVAICIDAELTHDGDSEPLDLTRKAGQLLAESAALVLAQRAGEQLENRG